MVRHINAHVFITVAIVMEYHTKNERFSFSLLYDI